MFVLYIPMFVLYVPHFEEDSFEKVCPFIPNKSTADAGSTGAGASGAFQMKKMSTVGVDVGGTFTDVILADPSTNTFCVAKVPTSSKDQSLGFMNGLADLDIPLSDIESIIHGTTVGTNAILERKGATCGLITTRGFRDILEVGRRTRPNAYGMIGSFESLIPRELRLEVSERVDAEGNILVPLNEDEVRLAIRKLISQGAEALVIHFLHSYANPTHEQKCYEIAQNLWPNHYISVGSQILAEVREFERGSTTALNAYVQPIMANYVTRLSHKLLEKGFSKDFLLMQGNGGMMSAAVISQRAAHTFLSGPAAGVIAAMHIATQAGFENLITCDMGGTSFDVAVVRNSSPSVSNEREVSYSVPIRLPMIDIHTIGAGGGSMAQVNKAGILQVGPESAGSHPGPICYGRGGIHPTVTDANVLLGRISPWSNIVKGSHVDLDTLRNAMEDRIGAKLGLNAEETAASILAIANNQLASAIRLMSIEKGYDPRDFVLFAFGGAGPLHVTALARELGVSGVLVPRFPGITSALGCTLADLRHDFVQTVNQSLQEVSDTDINSILENQIQQGKSKLDAEGVSFTKFLTVHELDLLYEGQSHLLRIELANTFNASQVSERFAERYRDRFDITLPEMRAILVNVRTTAVGFREKLDLKLFASVQHTKIEDALDSKRYVYFDGEWLETPIYLRDALPADAQISGPAIVEQSDATTVIEPESIARVDEWGNLIVNTQEPTIGSKPTEGERAV